MVWASTVKKTGGCDGFLSDGESYERQRGRVSRSNHGNNLHLDPEKEGLKQMLLYRLACHLRFPQPQQAFLSKGLP